MGFEPDAWLSDALGRPAYVLRGDPSGALEADAFAYARVPAGELERVRALERAGFEVVDVNVTLAHAGDAPPDVAGVDVGPATEEELPRLVDIAGSCFTFSRFHVDPNVTADAANRVKREWIRSYAEGRRGIELLAARVDGGPVGFLAVLGTDGAAVIDLVGVEDGARGRGVGTALVNAFVERHRAPGTELRVGTQFANVPSLRMYERCGFVTVSSAWVLHRHGALA